MRIGDTEREQALAALGEHMSAGRLNIDEYGERSAKVTAARTHSELMELFTDLPAPKPGAAPKPQPAAAPQPPATVPGAPVEKRSNAPRISMAAVAAASWPVAIGIGLITRQWEVIAVPVLLSWFMGALFGGRRRDEEREQDQRHRDQWRQARHQMRDEMHRQRRELRGRD
ncbi:hypothetical protein JJ691_86660 [Kutzneria sp. CA-103260]|nr:hypothetical protein JJ691_86660 [Kutzneria sp. CA-103260]